MYMNDVVMIENNIRNIYMGTFGNIKCFHSDVHLCLAQQI